MTADPDRCIAAAVRVIALIRDLRRRNEEWAHGDAEGREAGEKIARENPDVSTYDEHFRDFDHVSPPGRADECLVDVVAAIISEEVNRR